MESYKLILCPTDLTPGADTALGCAAEIAVATDARLLVVKSCEGDLDDPADSVAVRPAPQGLFEESITFNVAPDLVGALRWEGVVASGPNAAEAIIDVAAGRWAHLIVMRSRHRPIRAALLGSTSEAVCRTAPCSVMVTHPVAAGGPSRVRFSRILVAYDFWDDAEIALQHALALAARPGAEVHLLHVIPPPQVDAPEIALGPRGGERSVLRVAERLHIVAPLAATPGVTVIPHVVLGQPYREILSFAEANDVDLICMGARGRGFGARSLFGSNSDRVLRQATCPVLVGRPLRPSLEPRMYGGSVMPDDVRNPSHIARRL
jgi:nucleotide-binding universal stress UspA family protein